MIIETSDNRFFNVVECPDADMAHLWHAIEMKRTRDGFIAKTTRHGYSNWTYIRKAATRVVQA